MAFDFTRREFLKMMGVGAASTAFSECFTKGVRSARQPLYIGTYTNGASEGIYFANMDTASGALELKGVTKGISNPSFLAVDRQQRFLYAVSETPEFEGEPGGSVHAYAIDSGTGNLRHLNARSSRGGGPCHLTVDAQGRNVLVANYSGGNVAVLPIQSDGSLLPASDVAQHEGSSITKRQQGPHAHSVTLDAAGRFAFVADLGLDKVMIYRFDGAEGQLTPGNPPWAQVRSGAGPRHFAFHPDGTRAYVINELDSTLTAFTYDPSSGRLTESQTLSTLPDGFTGDNYPADVHVAASGRYVYGSNRGHDSIVVFAIDPETGALTTVQHQSVEGKWPRNFALDPTGQFLLVANQNSNTVVVFAIDADTGKLTPTGQVLEVPTPVCLRFMPPHS